MIRAVQQSGFIAVFLLAALYSRSVQAGAQDKAVAESLFREAIAQMMDGNYQTACPKLAESQTLEPAVGTLLYLGECYEQLGLTASAWATFTAAIDAAKRVHNREREQIASERATRLVSKIQHLTIVVPERARIAGLEVKQDGRVVGEAAWGVALPIDPGVHTLEATAPGRQSWTKQVSVDVTTRGGFAETVPMLAEIVPEPEPVPAPPVTPPQPVITPLQPPKPKEAPQTAESSVTQQRVGLVLGGAGVVAIGIGTGFGIKARAKEKDSEAYCLSFDKSRCNHQGVVLIDEGKSAATVANVAFIGGAAAIIGGAVLYFSAPARSHSASPAHALNVEIVPELSRDRGTLTLQGTF